MTAAIAEPSGTASLVVDVITGEPAADWNAYVESRHDASFYHRGEWAAIVRAAFGRPLRYLAVRDRGRTVGVLPLVRFDSPLFGRFLTSMPFVNYGGVLADTPEAEAALMDAAIIEARAANASYLELRHTRRTFPDWQARTHKVSMILPLEGSVDLQWHALDRKLRNQVRKAEKSGLTASEGGAELLEPFYRVLSRNMRDLGSPVHSIRFFREVLNAFPAHARVFCVSLERKPIAASIALTHGQTIEVPWASAIRDYNPLCPNVLLYWRMITAAIQRGGRRFDFGRSTPGEGTALFKAQWGAQPQPLYWEYWFAAAAAMPDRGTTNPKFARAIDLWQRLPLPVANFLGPLIVRHVP